MFSMMTKVCGDSQTLSLYREIFAPDIVYVYTCIFVP